MIEKVENTMKKEKKEKRMKESENERELTRK